MVCRKKASTRRTNGGIMIPKVFVTWDRELNQIRLSHPYPGGPSLSFSFASSFPNT